MSKSKEPRWYTTEDGQRAQFNQARYLKEFRQKAKELNRDSGRKTGAQITLHRWIAKATAPYEDEATAIARIRQWSYGNNSPGNLEDIYTLASVFGYEDRNTFLIFEKNDMEAYTMNTNDNTTMADSSVLAQNTRALKNALFALEEKETAADLYAYLLDLLAKTYRADVQVWEKTLYDAPKNERWHEAASLYPSRYDAIITIRKTATFLPERLREQAISLIDDVLGFDVMFDCVDHPVLPNLIEDEFITLRNDQFKAYVSENKIDLESRSKDDIWVDFINDQAESWYAQLDEIFEEYLR